MNPEIEGVALSFFFISNLPSFFQRAFYFAPSKRPLVFFFTQNICEPSFFLRANLHNFFSETVWPSLASSRTPYSSPHPTTSHSLTSPVTSPPTPGWEAGLGVQIDHREFKIRDRQLLVSRELQISKLPAVNLQVLTVLDSKTTNQITEQGIFHNITRNGTQ